MHTPSPLMLALEDTERHLLRARELRLADSPTREQLDEAVAQFARLADLLGQATAALIMPLDDAGRRDHAKAADQAIGHLTAAREHLQRACPGGPPA
jgi:hypothetical protein